MSQQRQIYIALQGYMVDHDMFFPQHKHTHSGFDAQGRPAFWATDISKYHGTMGVDVFRCSTLRDPRNDYEVNWEWAFDQHRIGYGYNAFYLGIPTHDPLAEIPVAGFPNFQPVPERVRMEMVRNPSRNLVFADANPVNTNTGIWWSSTIWWPQGGHPHYEGINDSRHLGVGVMIFNDGHGDMREAKEVNPETSPHWTGDETNWEYWDFRL